MTIGSAANTSTTSPTIATIIKSPTHSLSKESSKESKKESRPRGRPRKDSVTTPSKRDDKKSAKDDSDSDIEEDIDKGSDVEEEEKEYICPQCEKPDNGTPMIGCDKCDEWYHWQCVGILTAPKPEANWMCTRCKKKKQTVSVMHKAIIAASTPSTATSSSTAKYSSTQWQCPSCKTSDDKKPSIGCDECDRWYHWQCVGINIPPRDEDSWFCPHCIEKQAAIAYKFAKVRRL